MIKETRIKIFVFCILLITMFTSCGKEKISFSENGIKTIDENDYIGAEIISQKEERVLFKKCVDFQDVYPNAKKIDLSDLKLPDSQMSFSGIDDDGLIYFTKDGNETEKTGKIYSYDYKNNDWNIVIDPEEKVNCSFISANGDYLLWMSDEKANWQKTSLHIYDIKAKKDKKFYTHTTDPKSGFTYVWQFTDPVLFGNTILFEDTVGIDSNEIYKIKVFSYDIKKDKITEISDDAKSIMEYKGEAAWLVLSKDKVNSVLYSQYEKKALYKTTTKLGSIVKTSNSLIVVNDYMSLIDFNKIMSRQPLENSVLDEKAEEKICTSYGIKVIDENGVQPVIVSGNYGSFITNPHTNGDFVTWRGNGVGVPLLYSKNKDRIISFGQITGESVGEYEFKISNNYILLKYININDSKIKYLFWEM